MIKFYECKCEFAVFPFGKGLPICIRDKVINKSNEFPMKPCIEKGCEHYKKKIEPQDIENPLGSDERRSD